MKSIVYKTVWDEWSEDAEGETVHEVKEKSFVELRTYVAWRKAVEYRDYIRLNAEDLRDETGVTIQNVRVLKVTTETIG